MKYAAAVLFLVMTAPVLRGDTTSFYSDGAGVSAKAPLSVGVGQRAMVRTTGDSVTAVGYGAAEFEKDVSHVVALGDHALAYASNCTKVVAIGPGTLNGIVGATNLTAINGHFFASQQLNAFWITPNASNSFVSAPISYVGGTLRLNAARIITPNGTISGSGSSAGTDLGCDYYVDPIYGADSNDGLSTATAKKTLDAAVSAAGDGESIGVFAGTYAYPAYYNGTTTPGKAVRMVALKGAAKTFIAGTNGILDRIVGAAGVMPVFSGFTITGMVDLRNSALASHRDGFEYGIFYGCSISSVSNAVTYDNSLFYSCIFSNCTVVTSLERQPIVNGELPGYNYSFQCDYVETTVYISCYGDGWGPSVGIFDYLDGAYLNVDVVKRFGFDPRKTTAGGHAAGARNSTIVIDKMDSFRPTIGCVAGMYEGCLIGMEGFAHGNWFVDCVVTNRAAVLEAVDASGRATATVPLWRLYGRGSGEDRLRAKAIRAFINGN